ncbi:MAG TPA: hypothetical protein PLU43_08630 [Lachnospiraceae bacterium]|nr:hypothetical protein [Lachnospiraceae bacterium]
MQNKNNYKEILSESLNACVGKRFPGAVLKQVLPHESGLHCDFDLERPINKSDFD